MKRWLGLLLTALLLLPLLPARGEEIETMPEEILSWMEAEGIPREEQEHLLFSLPDGKQQMVWMIWQRELVVWEKTDAGWTRTGEWSPGLYPASLQRQNPDHLLPDGSHAPDDLGFRVYCNDRQEFMNFCWVAGKGFLISGWYKQGYDGEVMVQEGIAGYYPAGSTEPEAQVDLSFMLPYMPSMERLPATPQEAAGRAGIAQTAVAERFPGYTLRYYEHVYGDFTYAQAAYSRVEDGVLYIKWAKFWADQKAPQVEDCMPVPLSAELLSRLETEDFDALLGCSTYGSLFLTEAGLDTSRIPVEGRIIDSELKGEFLLLLTQDGTGVRRVWEVTLGEDGYAVRATHPLPEGATMDTIHAGRNDVILRNDQARWYVQYNRCADGTWRLDCLDMDDGNMGCAYAWIDVEDGHGGAWRHVGTLRNGDLFTGALDPMPQTLEELAQVVDRTGWAVVNNPDPADRLHLRVSPQRGATSLGKFYNGTPVRVLEERGDWSRVEIGLDGNLTGWMMTKYLTHGEAMDQVQPAWLEKVYKQASGPQLLYPSAKEENPQVLETNDFQVVGVVEDDWYILLSDWGQTGYVPQSWLFDGNG